MPLSEHAPRWRQEDLGHELADEIHEKERAKWTMDQLAYDGYSAWPLRRELTPRERDILSRTCHDIMEFVARESTGKTLLTSGFYQGGFEVTGEAMFKLRQVLRVDSHELSTIHELARILSPRQD